MALLTRKFTHQTVNLSGIFKVGSDQSQEMQLVSGKQCCLIIKQLVLATYDQEPWNCLCQSDFDFKFFQVLNSVSKLMYFRPRPCSSHKALTITLPISIHIHKESNIFDISSIYIYTYISTIYSIWFCICEYLIALLFCRHSDLWLNFSCSNRQNVLNTNSQSW